MVSAPAMLPTIPSVTGNANSKISRSPPKTLPALLKIEIKALFVKIKLIFAQIKPLFV